MTTHGATTVSQHVLQTLAEHGQPITINDLLKLVHARYYEDEIVYRGIILTLINLGEVGIDGETMLLSLPQSAQGYVDDEPTLKHVQTSGPQCRNCHAFTTYARVRSHGLCMKCELERTP